MPLPEPFPFLPKLPPDLLRFFEPDGPVIHLLHDLVPHLHGQRSEARTFSPRFVGPPVAALAGYEARAHGASVGVEQVQREDAAVGGLGLVGSIEGVELGLEGVGEDDHSSFSQRKSAQFLEQGFPVFGAIHVGRGGWAAHLGVREAGFFGVDAVAEGYRGGIGGVEVGS